MINLETLYKNMNIKGINLIEDIKDWSEISTKTKIPFSDSEGYKYSLSTENISNSVRKNGELARFFAKNPYTYYNICLFIKINKLEIVIENFNNVSNAKDLITIRCLKHNIVFNKSWNNIKNGLCGCEKCTEENNKKKSRDRANTTEYVKSTAKEKYNIEIVSEEYINNATKLDFICNNHKDDGIQSMTWRNIISAINHPCRFCSREMTREAIMKTNDMFLDEVKKIHGEKYKVVTKYQGSKNKVRVLCSKCDNVFEIRADHFINGHGCGLCTKSKGEEKIKVILDSNDVEYIREYKFKDCIGISKQLPFDFYIPKYNLAIEYQGIQHFEPVEMFGGQEVFERQIINDTRKVNYCNKNNINLLPIPYWEEDLEKIIIEKINKIKEEI